MPSKPGEHKCQQREEIVKILPETNFPGVNSDRKKKKTLGAKSFVPLLIGEAAVVFQGGD